MKNAREIALSVITGSRGTAKLHAAFSELLAAHSMFNLWSYQSLKGDLVIDEDHIEAAGKRYQELTRELNRAWQTFLEAAEDDVTASRVLASIALAIAGELRAMLGDIDFYDDDQLSPWLGEPPAQSSVAPDSSSSVAPPGGGAPSSGPRVNAGIGQEKTADNDPEKDGP